MLIGVNKPTQDLIPKTTGKTFSITTSDCGLRDPNHWNTDGFSKIGARLVNICVNLVGEEQEYTTFVGA